MTKAKYQSLIDKSIEATLSAIELYNKPNFNYREESFTILMLNAWELLLKAKVLKDNKGKLTSLYVPINRNKKDGSKSKQITYKKNRAKNYLTLDLSTLINRLISDLNLKKSLEILMEIRDNSIHFMNSSKLFEKYMLETAIACLKNYSMLISEWFDRSLDEFDLFLIPLAFNLPETFNVENLKKESESHKRLLEYISLQRKNIDKDSEYSVTVVVNLKVERNKEGLSVKFDENGIPVKMESEEVLKKKYPLDHEMLTSKCEKRYKNFKKNNKFYQIRNKICEENDFKNTRYLDHIKKKGLKKDYYSSNIFKELDKYYEKKEDE